MMMSNAPWAALLFPVLLFSQGLQPPEPFTVDGKVTNSVTGEPVRKATVHLKIRETSPGAPTSFGFGQPPGNSHDLSATTDSTGSFHLEGTTAGEYHLTGERQGFLSMEYGAKGPNKRGTPLQLAPGQKINGVSVALIPQGVIAGKVLDDDGEPVAQVQVLVLTQQWMSGKLTYMPRGENNNNDLGEFRI